MTSGLQVCRYQTRSATKATKAKPDAVYGVSDMPAPVCCDGATVLPLVLATNVFAVVMLGVISLLDIFTAIAVAVTEFALSLDSGVDLPLASFP